MDRYNGKFSDQSKAAHLESIKFFKRYYNNFKKIDSNKLAEKENLDKKIIIHNLKIDIFYLDKIRIWESDPEIADNIGSLIFLLLNRDTISSRARVKAINMALRSIPSLLEQVKTRISRPYKLWTEMAIESCGGLKLFLSNLKNLKIKNIDIPIKAIEEYGKFLKRNILPKAVNKYNIGENNFRKLINFRELGLSIKEMLEIGERALRADKEELKEIAREINPKLTIKEVEKRIERKHSDNFQEILGQYERIVGKAKKFIIAHNLMDIPRGEKVVIRETPSFLAPTTPFAAYFSPPKFAKKKVGIYIVTPAKQKRLLEKHNYTSIFNTSAHEAYPGHHLQLVSAANNPSLVRTLSDATETVEGWAHYCEEYMRDVGFDNTSETRFIQTLDEIWRAARIIVDIKLHFGKMSFKEAVDFLIREAGLEKGNAVAEIKRYTKSPSYQLSYLVGKHLIKKLKREIQEKMGEKYSDRFFHEVILNAGSIPIKYLKEEFYLKI